MAFLFFVFAQAAAVRSGGQSAADAAALAAAGEARDRLFTEFVEEVGNDGDLEPILAGRDFEVRTACDEAVRLAGLNDATVEDCRVLRDRPGYTVTVRTQDTVGQSLIPGTEDETAVVRATAVIRGLCEVSSGGGDNVELECEEDRDWDLDPDDVDDDLEPRDLFHVYLDD